MRVEIVSVGSEIVSGTIADTNAAWLSQRLGEFGMRVTTHTAADDRREELAAVIREVSARADLAIVTGGLGPTRDDLTREVFAELSGAKMVEDSTARANMVKRFATWGATPSESNYKQSLVPAGSRTLQNLCGTACGFEMTLGKCRFFSLPGVPSEMKEMFDKEVAPALGKIQRQVRRVRSLHVYGMGESIIGEKLFDMMAEGANPEVATQASAGIVTLRVTATALDYSQVDDELAKAESEIRARIGSAIFGADGMTLQGAVAGLLEKHKKTVSVAESCTGGLVSGMLTSVPGISRFFIESAVTYADDAKIRRLEVPSDLIRQHGAVSREVAAAMAAGMRKTSGSDIALSITGIAGPSGGSATKPVGLVFFGLADSSGVITQEARFPGDREAVRDRAAKRALNMLRLYFEDVRR